MASGAVGSASLVAQAWRGAVVRLWCVHCGRYVHDAAGIAGYFGRVPLLVSYMTLGYYLFGANLARRLVIWLSFQFQQRVVTCIGLQTPQNSRRRTDFRHENGSGSALFGFCCQSVVCIPFSENA